MDAAGDIFIADNNNSRVVEVPFNGSAQKLVGIGLSYPAAVAVDGLGNVYISDQGNNRIVEELAGGGAQTVLSVSVGGTELNYAGGIIADSRGDLFIADQGNSRLLEVPVGGPQIALGSGFSSPSGVGLDGNGNLHAVDSALANAYEIQLNSYNFGNVNLCASGQSTPAPCSETAALNFTLYNVGTFGVPTVLTQGAPILDFSYTATNPNCTGTPSATQYCTFDNTFTPKFAGLRTGAVQVPLNGQILALLPIFGVGTGPQIGYGSSAQIVAVSNLNGAISAAVDGVGDIYYTASSRVFKERAAGGTPVAVGTGWVSPLQMAVDGAGNLYVADYGSEKVVEVSAAGVESDLGGGWIFPTGVAVDGAGNVYVGDYSSGKLTKLPAFGGPPVVDAAYAGAQRVAVDAAGDLFVIQGSAAAEIPADGGPSVSIGTGLGIPSALAVDAAADVFIADYTNNRVVEVPAGGGAQTTVGTGLSQPLGVAVDGAGNVFIADSVNGRILKLPRYQQPALAFATTALNMTSTDSPQNVAVENTGNEALNIAAVGSIGPNFSLSGMVVEPCAAMTLVPGQICSLAVSFDPMTLGPLAADLVLTDNALNLSGATQTIALSGTCANSQTITFYPLPGIAYYGGPGITLTASATSGLPVSFGFTGPVTLSENILTIAGLGTVTATAMQSGNATYAAATPVTQNFTVDPGIPAVTWNLPAAISVGTALSATQLDATAAIQGNFVYTPAVGTVLPAGTQTLSATFTPTDLVHYTTATVTVPLSVLWTSEAVAIGTTGTAFPVTFTLPSAVTLGANKVLTQGTAGLDFTDAGTGTCTSGTAYAAAATCKVNVTFKPKAPGLRMGAVELTNNTGSVVATAFISATGNGAQVGVSPATQGQIMGADDVQGVAVDGAGDVFVLYNYIAIISELPAGGSAPVSVASGFSNPSGMVIDGAGNLYIADTGNHRVAKVPAGGGTPTTVGTAIGANPFTPSGVAVDGSGDIFIVDAGNNNVLELPAGGGAEIALNTTVPLQNPKGIAVDGAGDIFIANTSNTIIELPAGGAEINLNVAQNLPSGDVSLSNVNGLAVDGAGDLFIADTGNNRVVEVPSVGTVSTTVGTGFSGPQSVAVDGAGDVFVADTGNSAIGEVWRSKVLALSFATTNVGSTSADSPQTVVFQNTGNKALTFNGVDPQTDFSFGAGSSGSRYLSGTLTAGQACALPVSFNPQTAGPKSETYALTDNALNVNGSPTLLTLTGSAFEPQVINFPTIPNFAYPEPPITLSATGGGSGNPVTFSATGVGTVSGNMLTITGVGQITITANQAGGGIYLAAAPVSQTITISKGMPVVSWTAPAPIPYGTALSAAQLDATCTLPGTFVYSPAPGTVLNSQIQTLMVTLRRTIQRTTPPPPHTSK